MDYTEIAARLDMTVDDARHYVAAGLKKIARAGEMETFATVVRLTHIEKAGHVLIRCGSIECRPEKWVFFGVETR